MPRSDVHGTGNSRHKCSAVEQKLRVPGAAGASWSNNVLLDMHDGQHQKSEAWQQLPRPAARNDWALRRRRADDRARCQLPLLSDMAISAESSGVCKCVTISMTSESMYQVKHSKLGMHDQSSNGPNPCLCGSAGVHDGLKLLMSRMALLPVLEQVFASILKTCSWKQVQGYGV